MSHPQTPVPVATQSISSIDCKILQFKYAIYKITKFQSFLSEISHQSSKLSVCHYLTLMSGNIFAINEGMFASKLEAVSNFKLFRISPINISPIVSHIPYDSNDMNVNPLVNLPSVATSIKSTKLLETLYSHCLEGYEKRLAHALKDLPADYDKKFDPIVQELFGDDIDIVGSPEFMFDMTKNSTLLEDNTFMEATLIDIDIRMIFMAVNGFKKTVEVLKKTVTRYKALKSTTPVKNTGEWPLALHKIMLLTLRLNDIYIILRRVGRKAYLSNFQHLNDQKFVSLTPNSSYFKFTVLKNIDEVFNQTKKNGVLIANLTRLLRQNAKFEVTSKNILDFNNFAGQGVLIIENTLNKLEEFGKSWLVAELRFRKNFSLPQFYLTDIHSSLEAEKREAMLAKDASNLEKNLKKLDLTDSKEKSIFSRTSRSSSISSNTSTQRSNSLTRKASLTNRNSLVVPRTTSPRQQRPNSMIFLSSNSSLSSLPIKENPPVATTRKRSNSQPQSTPEHLLVTNKIPSPGGSPLGNKIASSGAAAALKQRNNNSPLSSRHGSITRKTAAPSTQSVIPEERESVPKKLSANQRFQLHLKQGAKNGSLMTQEKEVLTSVVFDPNSPHSVNLRANREVHENVSPEPESKREEIEHLDKLLDPDSPSKPPNKAVPPKRKTRDEITKRNTKHNSELASDSSSINGRNMSETSSNSGEADTSISSEHASTISGSVKKVRFTGVPKYTAAEDAPTKASAKILKNFAVFRTVGKPTFKRKDQMLKKEESLSFKQLHGTQLPFAHPEPQPFASQTFLASSLQNTKFKLKSKLT